MLCVIHTVCVGQGLLREGWLVYQIGRGCHGSDLSPEFYTCAMYIASALDRSVAGVMQEALSAGVKASQHMHAALVVHRLRKREIDDAIQVRRPVSCAS